MENNSLAIGDLIEVTTERLAFGGEAVARHGGLAIFIPFAAPDERLRVRVIERKPKFARAMIEDILTPSPARCAPRCAYFGECGGCQLQHLNYAAQLEAKAGFVRDALARVGKIDWPREIKVHHADEYGYRARAQIKVEATVGAGHSRYRIGFNRIGSHSICDVESCPVLAPELDVALGKLRAIANATGADDASPIASPLTSLPEIDIAAGDAGIAVEPPLSNLPAGVLQRTIGGMVYRFNASTFFQANPLLLDALIAEAVGKKEGALAIDLYAGVGLFTLPLAKRFRKVIGVESDKLAARFATENIAANKLTNAEFYHARVEQWLSSRLKFQRAKSKRGPDLLLLDPPRAGASAAIPRIAELGPERIVYVSCDPTTLARDLRRLIDLRFKLERVTAIDLFPQTYHIETVAQLRRA